MKKLNTSFISPTASMPIKQGTLDHLQAAYQESIAAVTQAIVRQEGYSTANYYLLYGCDITGTYPGAITIAAGAIFNNGEIFAVNAYSGTISSGQVPVATLTTAQLTAANADPVTFTDNSNHNVHDIRTLTWSTGGSGSGLVDYANILKILKVNPARQTYGPYTTGNPTITFDKNVAWFDGSSTGNVINFSINYDFTNAIPGAQVFMEVNAKTAGISVTLPTAGSTTNQTMVNSSYIAFPAFTITKNVTLKFTYLGRFLKDTVLLDVYVSSLP